MLKYAVSGMVCKMLTNLRFG